MLSRLGFQLPGGLQVRHEREVDKQAVFASHLQRDLPNGFEKRQAFDIAHGAPDLRDHHIGVGGGEVAHHLLDLVGDVRNHLHRLAQKLPAAFLVDHRQIDLTGGVVAHPGELRGGEPLVVAQIEIGFAAVVEDIHLPMLVGAHGAGIDVDVGIELLHPHPEAAGLQKHADRGAGEPLPERTDDAAGHKDMPGHGCEFLTLRLCPCSCPARPQA